MESLAYHENERVSGSSKEVYMEGVTEGGSGLWGFTDFRFLRILPWCFQLGWPVLGYPMSITGLVL